MILENGNIIRINSELSVFDIKKIYETYKNEYGFLYENSDNVAGYDEALEFYTENFDALIKDDIFRKYIFALCTLKQDGFTSDREIVALMFAFEKYNVFLD